MNQNVFKEMLKEKGLKVTIQRLLVLEMMAEHPGEHLTAEQIFDMARARYPEIGLATIYRTVQVLVDLHVIDKVSFDDGFARYELGEIEGGPKHHHHHAICRKCGQVISFEDDLLDTLEKAVYDRIGFKVVDHEVKLYGFCRDCEESIRKEEREEQILNMEVSD